ncbi:MAG: 2-keto-4-pentenoate hydratase [Neorhizobium sp.]|nr:2-keto-4-pentenoate hydratase [Neorhizobium sp.]
MPDSSAAAFDTDALAKIIYGLRTEKKAAPTASFPLPPDLSTAAAAAAALAKLEGATGAAWKVATTPDKQPTAALMHPYEEDGTEVTMPYGPGMRFEVEIPVLLSRDLPPRAEPYSRQEIIDAVEDAYLGAELLFTAIEESGSISYPLYFADRIGNGGFARGPVVPKSLIDEVGGRSLKVTQGDTVVYDGAANHATGDVLAWLTGYANDPTRSPDVLVKGKLITTGALSGAMPLPGPGKVDVLLDGKYAMSVTLKP